MSPTQSSLRDQLHADSHVFADEIDEVLHELSPDLCDDWDITDGFWEKGATYEYVTDDHYSSPPRRSDEATTLQFVFRPAYYGNSEWHKNTRYIWLSYDTSWRPAYDVDTPAYGRRTYGKRNENSTLYKSDTSSSDDAKYMVGGPLVDPLVSASRQTIVSHLRTQLDKVKNRVLFNLDIEACAGKDTIDGSTPIHEAHHRSPARIGGIGQDSLSRMATWYGTHSNILLDEPPLSGPTTAWGRNPDYTAILEEVAEALDKYFTAKDRGLTRSDLDPEDLTDYPKPQPTDKITYRITDSHTHRREDPIPPLGCEIPETIEEYPPLDTDKTVRICPRSDGYWVFTPLKHADTRPTLVVPFGTESTEANYLEQHGFSGTTNQYITHCQSALRSLDANWNFRDTAPVDNTYLSRPPGWTPTVRTQCSSSATFPPAIDYLAHSIPWHIFGDDWTVSSSHASYSLNKTLKLKYRYDESTPFTSGINTVSITCDDDGVYALDSLGSDHLTTPAVSYLIPKLQEIVARVETAFDRCTEIQQMHAAHHAGDDTPEQTYTSYDPKPILPELDGIGVNSAHTLAEEYTSYANILDDESVVDHLSHHFDGDATDIHNKLRPLVTMYKTIND